MCYLKQMAFLSAAALALIINGLYPQTADAQVACCRINAGGALISSESSERCNPNSRQTRKVHTGIYEVDFLPPLTDVRSFTKLATADTQKVMDNIGSVEYLIGIVDHRDISSVWVRIRKHNGALANAGFNLCLF